LKGEVRHTDVDENSLDDLLGLHSSKIGFYAEVKQKIQELEAANLGLRTKKSELQAVFDAISDGLIVFDSRGIIQHRNHVCSRHFPAETMAGRACRHLFHPEVDKSPASCPVEKALNGEHWHVSMIFAGDEGKTRNVDVTATPIPEPFGANRALLFMRDVTDKRSQELQLLQAEKMSSIGVLAAGVAHEINNPLNSVAGYAEALLRRFRERPELSTDARLEDFTDYLQVIIRESYRCKGIIDSLLTFSRKSDGSHHHLALNGLIEEVLELVHHKSRFARIEIRLLQQPDLPAVEGDPSALRQVFMNLIMNAFHAIEASGVVEIATFSEAGQVIATVRDSGCGIPAGIIEQIWSPFFTTKSVGQGLGLGLAVTYNIIQNHHGDIEVESEVGKGTLFTVRLPACQKK
jgi:two-component system, NtrC family, sensor kinase